MTRMGFHSPWNQEVGEPSVHPTLGMLMKSKPKDSGERVETRHRQRKGQRDTGKRREQVRFHNRGARVLLLSGVLQVQSLNKNAKQDAPIQ